MRKSIHDIVIERFALLGARLLLNTTSWWPIKRSAIMETSQNHCKKAIFIAWSQIWPLLGRQPQGQMQKKFLRTLVHERTARRKLFVR